MFLHASLVQHHGAAPPANLVASGPTESGHSPTENTGEAGAAGVTGGDQIWGVAMAYGSSRGRRGRTCGRRVRAQDAQQASGAGVNVD
jgi:hypothetical protein